MISFLCLPFVLAGCHLLGLGWTGRLLPWMVSRSMARQSQFFSSPMYLVQLLSLSSVGFMRDMLLVSFLVSLFACLLACLRACVLACMLACLPACLLASWLHSRSVA